MTSSDNADTQRLIQLVEKTEKHDSDFYRQKMGVMWKEYMLTQVDLSPSMCEVVRRQGYNSNRAKPIGIFLGNQPLIAKQDNRMAVDSDEAKRRSLIESFYYHAEVVPGRVGGLDRISRDEVIPHVVEILKASALPTPATENLEQYVETHYRAAAQISR
jgi:hypothetical protein